MIKLENITKYYKYKNKIHYVFKDFSYEFPTRQNIGILGRNGAGKSTLLRIIGGMESPNKGKVVTSSRISWPVGRTQGVQGSLTARDNVKFVCQIYGKTLTETRGIINYVQDFAEIGKHFDMPVKTYSSGMKARVNFGLSMAFEFDYYLIDECTSVGDQAFKNKAKNIFAEKKSKASIVLVSHNIKQIKESCDVVLIVGDGQVKLYKDVEEGIEIYRKGGHIKK